MNKTKTVLLMLKCVCFLQFSAVFPEIRNAGETQYFDLSVFSNQNFLLYQSALNPDNVFKVTDGYNGQIVYAFGYKLKTPALNLIVQDFGFSPIIENPDMINRIGELYLSLPVKDLFFDIGKKRINQSVSYFRSPINFAIRQNTDLSRDNQYNLRFSEGEWMGNIDYYSPFGLFGFSYMPTLKFNADQTQYFSDSQKNQFLLRYSGNFDWIDTGAALSREESWRLGGYISAALGNYLELHSEYVWFEKKRVANCLEGIFGLTLNLDRVTGIFEYYYTQSGYDTDSWNDILDSWKKTGNLYDANPADLSALYNMGLAFQSLYGNNYTYNCRHYVMIRLSNNESEKYKIALTVVSNLQDLSGKIIPSVSYEGWDNLTLQAYFTASYGNEYSEFRLFGTRYSFSLDMEFWL